MQKPQVSVVIPCFRQGHLLQEAIESVLSQGFSDLEILIVNDGSPDDTQAVAQRLIDANPDFDIRCISTRNQGVAHARNTAIRASGGKFILPLDADDRLESGFLKTTLDALTLSPNFDIAFTDLHFFGHLQTEVRCGHIAQGREDFFSIKRSQRKQEVAA